MHKSKMAILTGMIFIGTLIGITFLSYNKYMAEQTINDVRVFGEFLVKENAKEEIQKIHSIAELRISQVKSIIEKVEKNPDIETSLLYKNLYDSAEFQKLTSCLLIAEDNTIETIYGEEIIRFADKKFLISSLDKNQFCITGAWTNKIQVVVFTVPFHMTMKNNKRSKGILCCRPMSIFASKLDLNNDEGLAYYHLIRNDSSYVVKNLDSTGMNYFEKVKNNANPEDMTKEEAIEQLKYAISTNSDFFMHTQYVDNDLGINERRSVFAKRISNTNWYLVSIIPYKQLDKIISSMGESRNTATFLCLSVITLGILAVFFVYLRMTQRQIISLERAMSEARTAKNDAEKARNEAEIAREEAEAANKAKSDFLSNMSHDIRTPMNAIVGMTAIAKEHLNDTNRVQDCLKKISLSGKQLLGLINDVLDMSKIESGKMTLTLEKISLRDTMETMCDIVRSQIKSKGLNFEIHIHDIITEDIYCDSVRLNQVLLNFLSNAMKFTEEGGSISIELYQEKSAKGENFVRNHFFVKDTGIGMSPEFKEKLFSSFEREDNLRVHKIQGTGLGMAICKYIIDAMSGTIIVDSTQNVGTTFHVILDLEKANETEDEMHLPDFKILVVDDDKNLCETAALTLSELGTRPDVCYDGYTAVKMIVENHKKSEDYFAVLIDYKMQGMDGIETAKKIKESVGDVTLSLISAYDWTEIEDKAKEAGITGFISKPLFKSTLYHELKKHIDVDNKNEEESSNDEKLDISGISILLAEDNEINAEIATVILEGQGALVEHAEDGKKAFEIFKNSDVDHFKIILMDLRMPNMNGYEATKAIRALDRPDANSIPIIALTADAFAEDAKECLAAGMNAHLAKPIDLNALNKTLLRYL